MNIEEIRNYALSLPKTTENFPFGEDILVFKVLDKIFILANLEKFPLSINLKCEPDWAIELRENHSEITAGYHMNKKYWNTIQPEFLPNDFVKKLIKHSYDEVIKKMPKKIQKELENTTK